MWTKHAPVQRERMADFSKIWNNSNCVWFWDLEQIYVMNHWCVGFLSGCFEDWYRDAIHSSAPAYIRNQRSTSNNTAGPSTQRGAPPNFRQNVMYNIFLKWRCPQFILLHERYNMLKLIYSTQTYICLCLVSKFRHPMSFISRNTYTPISYHRESTIPTYLYSKDDMWFSVRAAWAKKFSLYWPVQVWHLGVSRRGSSGFLAAPVTSRGIVAKVVFQRHCGKSQVAGGVIATGGARGVW
jgi:hypothetical protein